MKMNMRGLIVAAFVTALIAGCQAPERRLRSSARELERLKGENIELRRTSEVLERRIAQLQEEISRISSRQEPKEEPPLREGPPDIEEPVSPEVVGISLGLFTDSGDWDGELGDDGIVAFVTPKDSSGHSVKSPGSLIFELFDLRAGEKPLIMEWQVKAETLEDAWARFPPAYHFRLPWTGAKPEPGKLVLVVKFTSGTGETFSAMKQVTVR